MFKAMSSFKCEADEASMSKKVKLNLESLHGGVRYMVDNVKMGDDMVDNAKKDTICSAPKRQTLWHFWPIEYLIDIIKVTGDFFKNVYGTTIK